MKIESHSLPKAANSSFLSYLKFPSPFTTYCTVSFVSDSLFCQFHTKYRDGMQVMQPDVIAKASYVYKRGGKRKNWRKRWFCLSGTVIFYYTNSNRTNHKGTILLEDSKILPVDNGFTPNSIQIETPSRVYLISCETVEDRNDWISTIRLLRASSCAAVCFFVFFHVAGMPTHDVIREIRN